MKCVCLITLFVNVYCQETNLTDIQDYMTGIGEAVEGFFPCEDNFIFMKRIIGGRPSEVNYWDGTISLTDYKNLTEATVNLFLDSPAVLTLDEEMGRVTANGLSFRIKVFDHKKDIEFQVKAPKNKPFPNVAGAKLNGMSICRKPKKWKISIVGAKPIAISTTAIISGGKYCGQRQLDYTELIVHGKSTRYGDWPWHVALYIFNNKTNSQTYICGGTLISYSAVITGGHCVIRNGRLRPSNLMTVVMGKYSLVGHDSGAQERKISEIIVHERFNSTTLRNDIAILKLEEFVEYGLYIQPACLWPESGIEKENIYNQIGKIVGWGLNENDTLSDELKEADVTIVSDVECLLNKADFFHRFVYDNSLCAGNAKTSGPSACNGDSGGGLFIPSIEPNNRTSYYLRGVVSVTVSRTDKAVCDPNYYVVYTDAARYLGWINEHI